MTVPARQPETGVRRPQSAARKAAKACAALGLPALLLFGGAGRWDWPGAWTYLALLMGGITAALIVFAKFQPGLADERANHWREGKPWDKPLVLIVGLLGPSAVQLVCGLDKRFGWSIGVPFFAQLVAAAAAAAGIAIVAWAMRVNPFFSATVRIQSDRGHTVVVSGPYHVVRHPGYAGMLAFTLGGPILLGTLWGLVPAGLLAATLVVRTALEDRALRAELTGYRAYARSVPYRLVPWVW